MASSGAGRQGVVTLGGIRRSNRFSARPGYSLALVSPRGEKPPPRHPHLGAWRYGTPIYAIVKAWQKGHPILLVVQMVACGSLFVKHAYPTRIVEK